MTSTSDQGGRPEETARLTRGVRRAWAAMGDATLSEFVPAKGLRADVFAVARDGAMTILEVKSGLADWRADQKWPRYRDWCDRLYICVGAAFPLEALDDDVGVVRSDGFDAAIIRPAPVTPLAPARRKSLLLRFAADAARRLQRIEDPGAGLGDYSSE